MLVPAAQVAALGLEAAESARMMRLSSLRISNLSLRLAKGSPFHRPANFLQIKLSRDRASLGGPEQTGESVEPIRRLAEWREANSAELAALARCC